MKVLLVAYYFKPFKGVGAKRLSYWYDNMPKKINIKVITATKQKEDSENIVYIEPKKSKKLVSLFIKDKGIDWIKPIKRFYKGNIDIFGFDFILISGGPFMHFSLAKYFKKQTNAKILFDFRDPFSNNPLFNNNFVKYWIKRKFEQSFTKYADAIITVNKFCRKLITTNNKPIYFIDNGHDVRNKYFKKKELENGKTNLIFTGSFKSDPINLDVFSNFLANNRNYFFHHVGKDNLLQDEKNLENYKCYGLLNYNEAMEILNSADIAIQFTHGEDFKSSTKIFDYIAFNKKILIITEGVIKTGNIHEITKDYPNVQWSKNNEHEIDNSLNELLKRKTLPFDSSKYSREFGLKKLIKIFDEIS